MVVQTMGSPFGDELCRYPGHSRLLRAIHPPEFNFYSVSFKFWLSVLIYHLPWMQSSNNVRRMERKWFVMPDDPGASWDEKQSKTLILFIASEQYLSSSVSASGVSQQSPTGSCKARRMPGLIIRRVQNRKKGGAYGDPIGVV